MKRIIEVMGSRSTKYGGVESFMYKLAKSSPQYEYHFIYNEQPRSEQYLVDLKSVNAYVHIIDVRNGGYITNYMKFRSLVKELKPDIVHFHFYVAHSLWAPLCRRLKIRKIYKTVHGCLFYKGRQAQCLAELSLMHRIAMRWGKIYKVYDRVLCVSHYVRNQFVKVYGDYNNTEVVYMGTDAPRILDSKEREFFKSGLGIKGNTQLILSVMFAAPIKGCDILIKSLQYVIGDYKVLLVGMDEEENYTKEMRSLAKELEVESKIIWVGITNEVYKYMSIADIFVQPSRTDALPLASVEAMSHHLPVIATRTGGLPEVASSLFEYEDSLGLARCINNVLTDKEEYRKQSEKSYMDWCDHFSLSKGVERYLQLYES